VIDGFPAIVPMIALGFPAGQLGEGSMEDRVARLESRVASLCDRVGDLEQRLALLDERRPAAIPAKTDPSTQPAIVDIERTRLQQLLALTGRTLVVLGGAYLLRALTETHMLPASAGVGFGILYAVPWLLLASRSAARGAQLDAFAHALSAALIGYPLVWEATLRFNVVSPAQSAALLGLLTAGAFVLSSARSLEGLAWVVALGTSISAAGLAVATGDWIAYTVLAIAVGVATLWLGYTRNWTMLRWPTAAIANIMLLILTGRAAADGRISSALLVQMLMLGGYLGSFAIRTLLIGRPVIPFEVVQSIGVLAVAFGGAIALIRSTGSNVVLVGVASLVLAAAGYIVAFSFVARHRHVKTFFFYSLLAQLFAIVGIALCGGQAARSLAYTLVALVAAVLARHSGRMALSLQAAVYAIAAALASGLVERAAQALLLPPSIDGAAISLVQLLALSAVGVVTFLPVRRPVESWGIFARILRFVSMAMLVWTAAGAVIGFSIAILPGGDQIGGSLLATIRTAALVVATLMLAEAARHPAGREAAWLVYPMLSLTGVKVFFIDFPQGHPETLFAALALYGIALIAAPRMLRRAPLADSSAASSRSTESPAVPTRTTVVVTGEPTLKVR
jgi:hypothetical protein